MKIIKFHIVEKSLLIYSKFLYIASNMECHSAMILYYRPIQPSDVSVASLGNQSMDNK